METWEKHSIDLYTLAKDIEEKLYLQEESYKSSFYYAFNPRLQFLLCGNTDEEQAKLLRKLISKGMITVEERKPPSNLPIQFLSESCLRNKNGKIYNLTINPKVFNREYKVLRKYYDSTNRDINHISLPTVIAKVNDDFLIHQGNIISYKGKIIELEPQSRKVIVLIMLRSKENSFTSSELITDECLDEKYKLKVASKEGAIKAYIARTISDARAKFRIATNQSKKNYFPNQRGIGYTFIS